MSLRSVFSETMFSLMERDDKIVALLCDIGVFSFKRHFERWPMRVINTGIAEQASVGLAAGLALDGFFPVVHTISAFLVRRAYEQIYIDFGLQKLSGLFVGTGGANEYAKLGETHQCPEELSLMSHIPGMHAYQPKDGADVGAVIRAAARTRTLTYMRLEEEKNV